MLKEILSKVKSSPIIKLTTGSIVAQIITMLASPITTRLYSPEELGVYTLLLTVVNMFGPVLCGKIEMAIVTEKEEKKMYTTIVLAGIINIVMSMCTSILYTIYLIITGQFKNEYIMYTFIIFFVLLLNGFSNILVSYNNRNRDYNIMSTVYVIRTFIQNLGLVFFGIMKFSITGMILSQLMGQLVGIRKQSEKLIPNIEKIKSVRKADIKEILKDNYKLIIYTAPSTFCNSASYSLINFFITGLYGTTVFGYYSLSYRMLGVPLSLISGNVSKVFFERAADEMRTTGKYANTLKRTTQILAVLALAMFFILITVAPLLFEIIFGREWEVSGKYVQILVFMFSIRLVVSALTPALVIVKKQSLEIKLQIAFLIVSILTYIICMFGKFSVETFLTIFMVLYSIIYIIFYIVIYVNSKGRKVK